MVTEPGVTEPGVTEPGVTEPGVTELGATEPVVKVTGFCHVMIERARDANFIMAAQH